MHLTLTALVAGLVATAGAPSKAIADCVAGYCTDKYGNTFIDNNRNGIQDPGEPTQPCIGPGCPGYKPSYNNPSYSNPSYPNPNYYPKPKYPAAVNVCSGLSGQRLAACRGQVTRRYMYNQYGIGTIHRQVRPGYIGFGQLPRSIATNPIGPAAFTTRPRR
jgi:hypothetical protein